MFVPANVQAVFTCDALVIGMIPGMIGTVIPFFPDPVEEIIIDVVVKKHLGCEVVTSRIYFFFRYVMSSFLLWASTCPSG